MSRYNNPFLDNEGCQSCKHFFHESEGEYGGGPHSWGCEKNKTLGNLKSFPFKKIMNCHEMDFWCSEFAEQFGVNGDCEFDKFGGPIWETSKAVQEFEKKYKGKLTIEESNS